MAASKLPSVVVGYLVARNAVGGAREYSDGMGGWTLGRSQAFRFVTESKRFPTKDLTPHEWAKSHAMAMMKLHGTRCFIVRLVRRTGATK